MKKLFVLMMALVLCFSLVACTVNVNSDKKDDDKDDKTTEASTDTAADSESAADTTDGEEPDMAGHLAMVEELCTAMMDYSGEWYDGTCCFCEENCEEGYFICDTCIETETCFFCGNDLAEGEVISCTDCIYSMREVFDGSVSEEYTEEDAMMDYYHSVESILTDYAAKFDKEFPEGLCLVCESENDNAEGGLLFCTNCLESEVCLVCETTELEAPAVIMCTDCMEQIDAALAE